MSHETTSSGGGASPEITTSSSTDEASVPLALKERLAQKLAAKSFDAGASFCFVLDTERPEGHRMQLSTIRALQPYEDIWLVDHAWSFRNEEEARAGLRQSEALRQRLLDLLEISVPRQPQSGDEEAELILSRLGPWTASYRRPSGRVVSYIMDEVGSRLQPPDNCFATGDDETPPFACALVLDGESGAFYSAFWNEAAVGEGEVAHCRNLPNRLGLRLAALGVLGHFEDAPNPEETAVDVEELHGHVQSLRECLLAKGFNVPRVSSLLGLRGELGDLLPVWELSSPHLQESLQEALAEGRDNGEATLELLVRLFLLRTPVDRNRIIAELGQNVWDALVGLRMLHPALEAPHLVVSMVQLSPVATSPRTTLLLATDFSHANRAAFDPVMYVGIDSLGLVAAVERQQVGAVLDLCAGCGVQGLAALQLGGERATLVELNTRAARFARFNALLNNLAHRVSIVTADVLMLAKLEPESLGEVLESPCFDLILANPPYIPSGGVSGLHKYGDGGMRGEEVLEGVVRLSAKVLHPQGRLNIVANLVNVTGLPDRVRDWWRGDTAADVAPEHAGSNGLGGGENGGENGQHGGLMMMPRRPPRVRVFHGRQWSVEEYASLLIMGKQQGASEEPAALGHNKYFRALVDAGISDVSNGFVFVRHASAAGLGPSTSTSPSTGATTGTQASDGTASLPSSAVSPVTVPGVAEEVVRLEDELWQLLAIGDERSTELKRQLRQPLAP